MISKIVTCEEHIKSLERAKSIILSAYILDMPNELSLIRSRIIGDIEQGITHYKEWIKKHSDLP